MGRSTISTRKARVLCAAASAAGLQLFGVHAGATTAPTITDCEVIPVEKYAFWSDSNTYAHFYIEWDGSGQSSNTMYFYRGLNSTSPISTTAFADMSNLGLSGWHTCGVVINDFKDNFGNHTYTAHAQTGAATSDSFYWSDFTNQGPDTLGKADLYDHNMEYEIGVQAYDGSNWSSISWAGAADNT